jgi:predicted ATPase
MIGHRLMGRSLLDTGDIAEGRAHCDQALALYDPAEHRLLATRFGQDSRVAILSFRSLGLWLLGYPEAALADTNHAIKDAREIGQAAALMFALAHTLLPLMLRGNYAAANAHADELVALAAEKGSSLWKACGMMMQGLLMAVTGKASNAVQMITSGMTAWRSAGSTLWTPLDLSYLAKSYAVLGQFDDAWRCVGEAMVVMENTKETWCEAEVHRMAGEIALLSPERSTKAEAYFERTLTIARAQKTRSWELRGAMSMARLWRDEGKRQQARTLLASAYDWFTEGFDTLDLREAKALLDELTS